MSSFYSEEELREIGFKKLGNNVKVSRKTSLYNVHMMEIGDDVRIDDFSLISGRIVMGNNVHIAAYVSLFAGDTGIEIHDFVGISAKSTVYAETDDYSGIALTNPTIEEEYKNIKKSKVIFGKHSLLGAGCIVLPGCYIEEGCSFGAMSLVVKGTEPWGVYFGIPCKRMKNRKKDLLELEKVYLKAKNRG